MTREQIRALQRVLHAAGYRNRDGKGVLKVDGVLGPNTKAALAQALERVDQVTPKSSAAEIRVLQAALNAAGFRDKKGNALRLDGVWGPLTASAVAGAKGTAPETSAPPPAGYVNASPRREAMPTSREGFDLAIAKKREMIGRVAGDALQAGMPLEQYQSVMDRAGIGAAPEAPSPMAPSGGGYVNASPRPVAAPSLDDQIAAMKRAIIDYSTRNPELLPQLDAAGFFDKISDRRPAPKPQARDGGRGGGGAAGRGKAQWGGLPPDQVIPFIQWIMEPHKTRGA